MSKKTLLFTTIGKLNSETERHTTESFNSWKSFEFDVVVFGEEYHKDLCDDYNFILVTNYDRNEFGLPFVRTLFTDIRKYTGYDVYCYLNSDIRFVSSPQYIIDSVEHNNFLLVGQRLDVYPDGRKEIHNPGGIDYYFYTPDFWDLREMPDFSIARGRFDHWLMGYAYTKGNGIVVDLTKEWMPVHPEPVNRVSGDPYVLFANDTNPKLGYQILRNQYYYAKERLHGQTNMTKFYFESGSLKERINNIKNEFGVIL